MTGWLLLLLVGLRHRHSTLTRAGRMARLIKLVNDSVRVAYRRIHHPAIDLETIPTARQDTIQRRRYQVNPERYEYVLTRKGRDTILLTQALVQVGDKWGVSGRAGPPLKFTNRKTGGAVKLAMVDQDTGETVQLNDLQPQPGPGADDLVRWRLTYLRS